MADTTFQNLQNTYLSSVNKVSSKVLHDIRSPLGSLDVALETLEDKTDQSVELIRSAIGRIKEVIQDLEYLREPTKPSCEKTTTVNVNQLVSEILLEKAAEFSTKEIVFENESKISGDDCFANVDGAEFKRLLSNIINNSVDAITEGSGLVQCRVYRKNKTLHIRIKDTGHGVPERIRGMLFNRGQTCGKKSGQGLGLACAREKLRAWRGDIKLFASDATGSIFHLHLPATSGEVQRSEFVL